MSERRRTSYSYKHFSSQQQIKTMTSLNERWQLLNDSESIMATGHCAKLINIQVKINTDKETLVKCVWAYFFEKKVCGVTQRPLWLAKLQCFIAILLALVLERLRQVKVGNKHRLQTERQWLFGGGNRLQIKIHQRDPRESAPLFWRISP